MARVVIEVTVKREVQDGCDACFRKDGTATQSVVELTLAGKTWFLCEEHETKWADKFTDILGEPGEGGE